MVQYKQDGLLEVKNKGIREVCKFNVRGILFYRGTFSESFEARLSLKTHFQS